MPAELHKIKSRPDDSNDIVQPQMDVNVFVLLLYAHVNYSTEMKCHCAMRILTGQGRTGTLARR